MNNRNLEQILNFASRQTFTNYDINYIENVNIDDNTNMRNMLTSGDRNRNVINYYQNMNIVSSDSTNSRSSNRRDYSYREPIFIPRTNIRNPFIRGTNTLFSRRSPISSNSITASGERSRTNRPPATTNSSPAVAAAALPSLTSILDTNFSDIYRTLNNRLNGEGAAQPNNISYTVEISNGADLESAFGFERNTPVTLNRLLERTELVVLADNNISEFNEMNCSICSQEFSVGQIVRKVTGCGHFFHQACIDRWFEENSTCPICRANLNRVESTENSIDPSGNNVEPSNSGEQTADTSENRVNEATDISGNNIE